MYPELGTLQSIGNGFSVVGLGGIFSIGFSGVGAALSQVYYVTLGRHAGNPPLRLSLTLWRGSRGLLWWETVQPTGTLGLQPPAPSPLYTGVWDAPG